LNGAPIDDLNNQKKLDDIFEVKKRTECELAASPLAHMLSIELKLENNEPASWLETSVSGAKTYFNP
jgi:hypothetical protein